MRGLRLLFGLVLVLGVGSALGSWPGGGASEVSVPALRVEVLNGCGEAGVAERAAGLLRALGHDVVRVGDATEPVFERSVVVDRRGRDRISRALAREIGPCPVVLERIDPASADLTLILGADYPRLRLFSGDGAV